MIQPIKNISVPNLSSSAILIDFSVSQWTGRKLDKRASEEVEVSNSASLGVANVHKRIMGKCPELDAIHKFVGNLRNSHYSMTLPWSDQGLRIVTTMGLEKYTKAMTERQQQFEKLVDKFIQVYATRINEAETTLGNLFVSDDYPSIEIMQSKFGWRLNFMPIQESGDFRVDIGNWQAEILKEQYTKYYDTQYTNAMNDLWDRLYKPLARMSERLDYPEDADKDTKKVFTKTLVSNVTEVLDLLKAFNVNDDRDMEMAHKKLRHALNGITPEALREDDHLRLDTKRSVDEVIKTLPTIGI
tara:strand:+ start:1107 stop:2006 length:900 start_codon:yes stop_codon:yes gene_type:complete